MAQTAQFDTIVVEATVTAEKVRELFLRSSESAKLDYKREYNPSNTVHKVKLAKHILAMSNTAGGYVLVGVEDDGTPVGLSEAALEQLDEATVRAQISAYTSAQIPIFVTRPVKHEALSFGIITVLPLQSTLAIASTDGNCSEGNLFRKGDVLVRHGSASERWNQSDAEFIIRRLMATRKEEWMREFGTDLRRLGRLFGGDHEGVPDEASYDLTPDDFNKLAIRLIRGR